MAIFMKMDGTDGEVAARSPIVITKEIDSPSPLLFGDDLPDTSVYNSYSQSAGAHSGGCNVDKLVLSGADDNADAGTGDRPVESPSVNSTAIEFDYYF